MKKIPIGLSDLEGNYYYFDKTNFIDEIIKDIDQYFSKLVNHILNDDVLKSELYDSIIFDPSVKSNKWIVETIEVSKYGDMVSIEGRFKLSLILDFNLNSVEFEIDDLHLFKDRILKLINNQTQTYWEYKFCDFSLWLFHFLMILMK